MPHQCRRCLCHLHQAQRSFLHSRATTGGHNYQGTAGRSRQFNDSRQIFSPTADPHVGLINRKSIVRNAEISCPPIFPVPQTTASSRPVLRRVSQASGHNSRHSRNSGSPLISKLHLFPGMYRSQINNAIRRSTMSGCGEIQWDKPGNCNPMSAATIRRRNSCIPPSYPQECQR